MTRRTSNPNKSSPNEKDEPYTTSDQVQQTLKLDYYKSQKSGTLKSKGTNLVQNTMDSLTWSNNNYLNVLSNSQIAEYYPQTVPDIGSYEPYVDWSTMALLQNLGYNVPVLPMVVNPLQNIAPMSSLSSLATSAVYGDTGLYSPPNYVTNVSPGNDVSKFYEEYQNSLDQNHNSILQKMSTIMVKSNNQADGHKHAQLFPPARNLDVDPNAIIDEFCKADDITEHVLWILDLEFGIPKAPVPRLIPIYDVQYNNICCRNTPGAIHPGFEKLCLAFQKMVLFHYDCVISKWFNGYMAINKGKSIQDFQSWLNSRMQAVGMCWP